jgi:hypothetical protein
VDIPKGSTSGVLKLLKIPFHSFTIELREILLRLRVDSLVTGRSIFRIIKRRPHGMRVGSLPCIINIVLPITIYMRFDLASIP